MKPRIETILKRIVLGLPVGSLVLIAGCIDGSTLDRDEERDGAIVVDARGREPDADDANLPDANVPAEDGPRGPYCMSCGSSELVVTHRDIAERGFPIETCFDACNSFADRLTSGCGGFPGAWWPMTRSCEVIERSATDAGPFDPDAATEDGGVDPWSATAMRVSCETQVCHPAGRRPSSFALRGSRAPSVAQWLAEVASLEAASVPAFDELRGELVAHGAPARFVYAAESARRDEVLHAAMMTRLAASFGRRPTPVRTTRTEPRSLVELAVHNAAEGCVRESYGALAAAVQAERASTARLRGVFGRIARDESRHALLSLAVDTWARPRLRAHERARCDEAASAAGAELCETFAMETPAMRRTLGLPDEESARELVALCA